MKKRTKIDVARFLSRLHLIQDVLHGVQDSFFMYDSSQIASDDVDWSQVHKDLLKALNKIEKELVRIEELCENSR